MLPISKRIEGIEESQTLAFTEHARRLKQAGVDVVSLTAGEPDFASPSSAKQAAIEAIRKDFTHYTPNQGIPELLDAIRTKFQRDNGLTFDTEQILVSTGAKQSMFNALQAICDPGDEVILIAPYWVSYPGMVRLAGAVPVVVPSSLERMFRPDLDAVARAVTPRTRAVIVNTPANPTGIVYTGEELRRLAAIAAGAGAYVISDEIYEKVLFDGKHVSIGSLPDMHERVLTVNGLSKAYAMTGWRIGYMGGPLPVIRAAAKVQGQVTSNANSIAQKAAVAALLDRDGPVHTMTEEFRRRRDLVLSDLASLHGAATVKPQGAIYFFIDVHAYYGRTTENGQAVTGSVDLARYLLETWHVGSVPGEAFGDDRCIRISFACAREQLREGLKRIRLGLEALK